MDDRILLIPPVWAPDIHASSEAASVRVLLERLESFLPLDIFSGPSLKGSKRLGQGVDWLIGCLREQVRPEHHILDMSTQTEALLVVLSSQPARSLTMPGFYASPATAKAAGGEALAAGMSGAHAVVMQGPGQAFPVLMEGADPRQVHSIVSALEGVMDRQAHIEVTADFIETDFLGKASVDIPILCLEPATNVPSAPADLLRHFASDVREGRLQEWGTRLQDEEGGHELADKLIPFARQVIAEREAKAQT